MTQQQLSKLEKLRYSPRPDGPSSPVAVSDTPGDETEKTAVQSSPPSWLELEAAASKFDETLRAVLSQSTAHLASIMSILEPTQVRPS